MSQMTMIGSTDQSKRAFKNQGVGPKEPLSRVIALHGLLPMCVHCNRIMDDKGSWHRVKEFDIDRCNAAVSHFICPRCAKKLYPEFYKGRS